MTAHSGRVVMGRVAAPYAVQGWIKVQPFTEYVDSLLDYPVWWVGREADGAKRAMPWRALRVLEAKVHGQTVLARLEGVADRNAAESLKGADVAVERAELPEVGDDEYYWDDLIGLEVVNAEGESLGVVDGLLETGAHEVLRVRGAVEQGGRERLIPFVGAYVLAVDAAARRITVNWPLAWDDA